MIVDDLRPALERLRAHEHLRAAATIGGIWMDLAPFRDTNPNATAAAAGGVDWEQPMDTRPTTDAKEFQAWWDRLPTKGKHAVIKRQERKAQRAQAQKQFRAAAAPAFICTCHKPHPTAAARKACRESHRSEV